MTLVDGAIRVVQTGFGSLLFILVVATGMAALAAPFVGAVWRVLAFLAFAALAAIYFVLAWRARHVTS